MLWTDQKIHCFKQHGPASNGRILSQQAREDADVEMLPLEKIDEYEDQENGYETLQMDQYFHYYWTTTSSAVLIDCPSDHMCSYSCKTDR
uniref:Uncharacterized protein n=1 Tax=Ditylenchus dipsaci TaxID=166011 RepID=A0A915DNL0_9BILA